MKKTSIIVILFLISLISAIQVASEKIAREGTISGMVTYSGSTKMLAFKEGTGVINWEAKGIWKEDFSDIPFDGSLVSCAGVHILLEGVGKSHGYCVVTDPQGDSHSLEVIQDNLKMEPGLQELKFTIIEGTGKFKGIQGEGVMKHFDVYPIKEETYQERHIRIKGNYKLP